MSREAGRLVCVSQAHAHACFGVRACSVQELERGRVCRRSCGCGCRCCNLRVYDLRGLWCTARWAWVRMVLGG